MSNSQRDFPAPWRAEQINGGFRVTDARGRALAYVYARDDLAAKAGFDDRLTTDEARVIAKRITKLPELRGLGKSGATPLAG